MTARQTDRPAARGSLAAAPAASPPSAARAHPAARAWEPVRAFLTARHAWWGELAAILGGYWLYELTRGAAAGKRADAFANGRAIYHFEQRLHLDPERAMNSWLSHLHTLSLAAGYYYGSLHFVTTVLVLGFLWWRRPGDYGRLRTVLVVVSLSCLLIFWLVPVAPPRLAVPGVVDTLTRLDVLGARHGRGFLDLANLYAAMPSLHMAWAAWAALCVTLTSRRRWLRVAVWLYPLTTALVVLATANHYLMDVLAGLVVLALSLAAVQLLGIRERAPEVPPEARRAAG